MTNFIDCRNPVLDWQIEFSEVNEALKSIRPSASPGPDGLSSCFYKSLPDK